MGYNILTKNIICEQEIKKSRFITYLAHTEGLEAARSFWKEIKILHPQARHHCWSAIAGAPHDSQQYGFSDDGEPTGTAGKPMISVLIGSNIGEISVVVVRYFGGILLGTGGLVKAYGSSVQQALKLVELEEKLFQYRCQIICEYKQIDWIQNILANYHATVVEQLFLENIHLQILVNQDSFSELQAYIKERSAGSVMLKKVENDEIIIG